MICVECGKSKVAGVMGGAGPVCSTCVAKHKRTWEMIKPVPNAEDILDRRTRMLSTGCGPGVAAAFQDYRNALAAWLHDMGVSRTLCNDVAETIGD